MWLVQSRTLWPKLPQKAASSQDRHFMCLALRLGRWVRAVQTTERIIRVLSARCYPNTFRPTCTSNDRCRSVWSGSGRLGPKWSRNSELCVSVFSSSKCVAHWLFIAVISLLNTCAIRKVTFGSNYGRPLDFLRPPFATIYDEFAQHTLRQGESLVTCSNMSTAPFRLLFLLYPSHPTQSPVTVR